MPQFDITILNTQICNIISFSLSYLFYLKSILLLLFVFIKSQKKILLVLLASSIEENVVILNNINTILFNIILFFSMIKLETYITKLDHQFVLYY